MGLSDIDKALKEAIRIATARATLDKVGDYLVDRIKKRTRLGKGVKEPEGRSHPLPKLKPQTVQRRRRAKATGDLSGPGATPAKSGLNRSGDMLDSLDHKVSSSKIEFKLDRSGERKAKDLVKQNPDFTFMNPSKPEVNGAVDIIEDEIKKKLK